MGTVGAIIEEEPVEATTPAARPTLGRGQAARSVDPTAMSHHLNRYLEALGLKRGATLDAINTSYYMLIKRFPENPTEEDETRLQEIKRAYDMLRRAYVPPKKKSIAVLLGRRLLVPVLGGLGVVLLAGLIALNWGTIKLSMTHYEPGAVLALKGQGQPYGQVVGFDPRHRFPAGNPSPAYAIRLTGSQDVVWVGEHLVINGMMPAR